MEKEKFLAHWTGEIVLLKRIYKLDDTNRRFGLSWFGPEFWRQRALLRNVVIAALAMHVLALAVPIFFQIVIDRVLVYLSISTLAVIGIGVVLAILFDAAFNWLRGYFVLRTASRIDIRLARTTFRHLMSLPISFFDPARAGVVTKHMQQGTQIREFLTGRLLGTLLDLPALLIFLPLMLWYSVRLTLVVLAVTALLGGVIAVMLGPYRRRLRHLYQAEAQRQSLLVESVHGMRTVKSLNLEPRREEAWDNAAADAVNTYVQVGKITLAANTLSSFIEKAPHRHHRRRRRLPGVRRRPDRGRPGGLQHAVVAGDQPGAAVDRPAQQLPGSHDVGGNAGRDHEPAPAKTAASAA